MNNSANSEARRTGLRLHHLRKTIEIYHLNDEPQVLLTKAPTKKSQWLTQLRVNAVLAPVSLRPNVEIGQNPRDMFRMTTSQELMLDVVRLCMAQLIVVSHLLAMTEHKSIYNLEGLRVTVFFMLSGFLIFSTTWRRQLGTYGFREFMIERSARLWVCLVPALIFTAIVAVHTMALPDYPAGSYSGPVQFVGNLLMLEDYPLFQLLRRLGFQSEFFIRPYAAAEPYWTLPIEFWLYVVFGFIFFFIYLRRGKARAIAIILMGIASFAVVYHGATGFGQCLSLVWMLGSFGPWLIYFDRTIQIRFGLSNKASIILIFCWLALCICALTLRGLSRSLNFYELQTALFLGCFLIGLIWLTGRVNIDRIDFISATIRWVSRQSYALYLTHNAVLTMYVANYGKEMTMLDGAALILAANIVGIPFYFLFDRHHKIVANWIKGLPGFRLSSALGRTPK